MWYNGPCKLCLRCRFSANFIFEYHRLASKWQYFTVTKYFDWKVVINSNKAVSDYSSPSPVQLIKGIIHLSNSKRTSKTSCKSKWCHIYAVILPIHLVHRPLKGWSLVCEVSVQQIENNINRWRIYWIETNFCIYLLNPSLIYGSM